METVESLRSRIESLMKAAPNFDVPDGQLTLDDAVSVAVELLEDRDAYWSPQVSERVQTLHDKLVAAENMVATLQHARIWEAGRLAAADTRATAAEAAREAEMVKRIDAEQRAEKAEAALAEIRQLVQEVVPVLRLRDLKTVSSTEKVLRLIVAVDAAVRPETPAYAADIWVNGFLRRLLGPPRSRADGKDGGE